MPVAAAPRRRTLAPRTSGNASGKRAGGWGAMLRESGGGPRKVTYRGILWIGFVYGLLR
jgi:hypothetical protein